MGGGAGAGEILIARSVHVPCVHGDMRYAGGLQRRGTLQLCYFVRRSAGGPSSAAHLLDEQLLLQVEAVHALLRLLPHALVVLHRLPHLVHVGLRLLPQRALEPRHLGSVPATQTTKPESQTTLAPLCSAPQLSRAYGALV